MMKKIKTYTEWQKLSREDKERQYISWNAYVGEGKSILMEAMRELRNKYGKNDSISEISSGLYHGGLWIINITVKKGKKIKLPSHYMGFPLLKNCQK